ncbi:hypothetical protein [Sphingomonas carotinifaciens]|uniref:hypothetical protein n=1 Tax=Sphingomonas carotinifaciens TaxID=1166323 RepID=UPI001396AB96|nr:hypothetical protein [Sphingomonas carotinifaciens]
MSIAMPISWSIKGLRAMGLWMTSRVPDRTGPMRASDVELMTPIACSLAPWTSTRITP